MALPYKHLTSSHRNSRRLVINLLCSKVNYDPTTDSGFVAEAVEAQCFSFKYLCRGDKRRKWKRSQMKYEGSRFLDGEEEGGVTGNLSSLQTRRREGTSLTKRQMDYFALSTVNINP